ncbi:hypothetical protein [Tychonema sp. LEGE 06208]|uniref:hypothetical protein n=1 Tax=Tychonema sp. LEGE 06208 TaxID=1828663 RepID=UPI0030DA79E6
MVAAQKFNEINNIPIARIYCIISSGTVWRFLKLEAKTLTIDLHGSAVPPVEPLLGMLVWMVRDG